MKKFIVCLMVCICMAVSMAGCEENGSYSDSMNTRAAASTLQENQPTPTDIDYSLERYNEEKQSWAEQAKMRANRTASTYNNYILENSYVWSGNVPNDIDSELDYLE